MKSRKVIEIPIPKCFSFKDTLSFLDRGFDECLYHLSEDSVSKLITLSGGKGLIHIYERENILRVDLQKKSISEKNIEEVTSFVIEWFDLSRGIEPFYLILEKQKLLAHFTKEYFGSRIVGIPNLFKAICWAIIGQQINLTFAYKLKRLLVEKYGEKVIINHQIFYSFPLPENLIQAKRDDLIGMKFSRQKIDYLKNISEAFIDNKINKSILLKCKNKNERIDKLVEIKGIGIWTANYVLMKSIKDMICITYGDSGLNNAISTIFKTSKKPTKMEIDNIFKAFKNWESYLNFYLWKSLS